MDKQKLLLHTCCGPCSTSVLERLKKEYQIGIFYYNPNIFPFEEFDKRFREQCRYIKESKQEDIFIVKGKYEDNLFEQAIKGFENSLEGGKRCEKCIELRLKKTAEYAKQNGFNIFASTLSVSPHKNADFINKTGKILEEKYNIKYLESDFKKEDGYLKSIKITKEHDLYRQNYCGCKYSLRPKISE